MLAKVRDTDPDGELDRGANSAAADARTCALTRELKPIASLVRFVVGPDGSVVPDIKRKLPGRGLWITGTATALQDAVERNVFGRGFKRHVRVAPDLPAQTEHLLERAALDALAMAGKARTVVSGFAKVEAAIDQRKVMALIHATDASADGKRKLNGALHRNNAEKAGQIALVEIFSGSQLDLALNRPNVVHAALLAGPGSETFLARVARLTRFRTGHSSDAVSAIAPTEGAH